MRFTIAIAAGALLLTASPLQAQRGRPDPLVEARVDSLLRRMTLEEKVGEMTQLTIEAVSRTRGTSAVAHELDSLKLDSMIVKHHVGSLLNVWDAAFTPDHWRSVTGAVQRAARRRRLPIPVLYGIDAVHGHHYMLGGTVFPQNLALAATWNPELVRRTNAITAFEVRASGIAWNFSPVLDLARQPLWSRFFETFGEDVTLASALGVAAVEGTQADPRPALAPLLPRAARGRAADRVARGPVFVAATGKHFLGYGMPSSGKDRTTAWIPERQLREHFLPTFRAAVDAGLRTIMVNSGDVAGVPVHASRAILTDLLRGELGFTGIAVTDWGDIEKLVSLHRVAATNKDAVRLAILAGIDMSMVPLDLGFQRDLLALVREGSVPEARIDESVRRILRVKLELGLFEHADADPAMLAQANAPAFRAVSRQAAIEAVTLLRNERGLLPLAPGTRVLVTGPGATSLTAMFGSWSYTWQGTDSLLYPRDVRTLLDAIRARAGADRVRWVPGATVDRELDVAAAVAAAREADVVVVALAEPASTEGVGDIDDLMLPAAQLALAQAVEATGTPVVLTIFHNRPRVLRPIVDSARAVVTAYETGPYGGEALAAVLFGDVNPSGRLPFSWPRATGAIEFHDAPASSAATYAPEWPFGHGLSYTTFATSSLALDRAVAGVDDTVTVTVVVANTGARAGTEVVQLYTRDLVASVAPPLRRLRAFARVALAPGERRTVTLRFPVRALAFVGLENRPVVEPGEFEVIVGAERAGLTVR